MFATCCTTSVLCAFPVTVTTCATGDVTLAANRAETTRPPAGASGVGIVRCDTDETRPVDATVRAGMTLMTRALSRRMARRLAR